MKNDLNNDSNDVINYRKSNKFGDLCLKMFIGWLLAIYDARMIIYRYISMGIIFLILKYVLNS